MRSSSPYISVQILDGYLSYLIDNTLETGLAFFHVHPRFRNMSVLRNRGWTWENSNPILVWLSRHLFVFILTGGVFEDNCRVMFLVQFCRLVCYSGSVGWKRGVCRYIDVVVGAGTNGGEEESHHDVFATQRGWLLVIRHIAFHWLAAHADFLSYMANHRYSAFRWHHLQ